MTLMVGHAATAFAGDSGLYYNENSNGQGILLLVDGDRYVTYLFTYGADDDYDYFVDGKGNLDGQRWFFGADEYSDEDERAGGVFYGTHGLNFPFGIPDKDEPFVNNVGETFVAGKYELRRIPGGFRLGVVPAGEVLDKDDVLYDGEFRFDIQLFEVDESEVSTDD